MKIHHVRLPCDVLTIIRLRFAPATLIVKDHVVAFREMQHLGKQVIMVRAGPTVKNQQTLRGGRTVCAPVERRGRTLGEPGSARRRDVFGHHYNSNDARQQSRYGVATAFESAARAQRNRGFYSLPGSDKHDLYRFTGFVRIQRVAV